MWPTPDASVAQDGETPETWLARRERLKAKKNNGNGCGTPLSMAAALWSTPRATDGEKGGPNQSFGAGGVPLASQAALWATPSARDFKSGEASEETLARNSHPLNEQARHWQTPNTVDARGGQKLGPASQARLCVQASSRQLPTTCTHGGPCRPTLNPRFVELMMNWPLGWTDASTALEQEAMASYRSRLASRFASLLRDFGVTE
jgi:hypothetical protein